MAQHKINGFSTIQTFEKIGRKSVSAMVILLAVSAFSPQVFARDNSDYQVMNAVFSFNKAAKPTKRLVRKANAKVYLGKAPYICSPSGFGRTSHCKLRTN